MIKRCLVIDCLDYENFPGAPEDEFEIMGQVFCSNSCAVHIFPFVRINPEGIPYVEVYVWDYALYPKTYQRFVICDGYCLSEGEEESFLRYIKNWEHCVDETLFVRMVEQVQELFPQWHFRNYSIILPVKAFEHIYYVSHPSGPKEILYKAELGNIAFHLSDIVSYNVKGTTPETIIGYNLPLRLLRILNMPTLIWILRSEECIEDNRNTYERYRDYIGEGLPSPTQWGYLLRLYQNNGEFAGRGFYRALYNRLEGSCYDSDLLDAYERFLALKDEFADIREMRLPSAEDIWDVDEKLGQVEEYREDRELLDSLFRQRKQTNDLEYVGEKYSVLMPDCVFDICREGVAMGNCVMDYIRGHAGGETSILFVRKNDAPEKSFVTMEVRDRTIRQAYAKYNRLPEKEIFTFLGEYSLKCQVHYEAYELVGRYLNYNEDFEDEEWFWRYVKERTGFDYDMISAGSERPDFAQISLQAWLEELDSDETQN